jgi:hypothetical protein
MNDETMLREALHELTLEQPSAPVDRVVGVRRRHVRRRTTQLGLVAGVVALITIAVAFAHVPFGNDAEPAQRPLPSWELPWPTRTAPGTSQPEALRARASAFAAFQHSQHVYLTDAGSDVPKVSDLHMLYVGRPAGMEVFWVIFEATWGEPPLTDPNLSANHHIVAMASPSADGEWTTYVEQGPALQADWTDVGFAWNATPASGTVLALGAPQVRTTRLVDVFSGDPTFSPSATYQDGTAVLSWAHSMRPASIWIGQPDLNTNYQVLFPVGVSGTDPTWLVSPQHLASNLRQLAYVPGNAAAQIPVHTALADGTVVVDIRCAGVAPVSVIITDGTQRVHATQSKCDGGLSETETLTVHKGDRLTAKVDARSATLYAIGIYLKT